MPEAADVRFQRHFPVASPFAAAGFTLVQPTTGIAGKGSEQQAVIPYYAGPIFYITNSLSTYFVLCVCINVLL